MEKEKNLLNSEFARIRYACESSLDDPLFIVGINDSRIYETFKRISSSTNCIQSANKKYHQKAIKIRFVNSITRINKIVHPDADDEALEKMAESGQDENIFVQQSVISVATRHTVNSILEEAKETRDDLEKLELSMNELLGV